MEPVDDTLPVKVRAPEVEVTVVPERMVEAPVTVRLLAWLSSVPPVMVSVPPYVDAAPVNVTVPVKTSALFRSVSGLFCVPLKRTVPVFLLKVPAFVMDTVRTSMPVLPLIVPLAVFVSAPVVVAVPEPTFTVPLFTSVLE